MNPAYNPERWSTFFSAQAGASAALVGLLFVAVSINLAKIIKMSQLVTRSAKALYALMGVLIASTLCMVPAQPVRCLGGELLFLGVLVWVVSTWSQHSAMHKNKFITVRDRVLQAILTQLSTGPFILAGASIVAGFGGGLYWLVPAIIFSFIAALIDAWVLLIEIQR
jgi:cellobiose-specific phosphotransferase system component IIC